jgi:hypothetical protein
MAKVSFGLSGVKTRGILERADKPTDYTLVKLRNAKVLTATWGTSPDSSGEVQAPIRIRIGIDNEAEERISKGLMHAEELRNRCHLHAMRLPAGRGELFAAQLVKPVLDKRHHQLVGLVFLPELAQLPQPLRFLHLASELVLDFAERPMREGKEPGHDIRVVGGEFDDPLALLWL